MKNKTKDTLAFFGFASPWIIGFIGLLIIPIGSSLVLSFTKWDILTPPTWVGLQNYIEIFNDPLFYKSLRVTLTYTLFSVPLTVIIAFFVALLLNTQVKGINVYRTIFYLPAVISGVAVALLWAWIFNPEFGLINNLLIKIGIEGPRWIYDEAWVMPSLIIMSLWGVGGGVILYLAGLQGIPKDLYEAATLDGVNWWHKLIYITLPSMSPIILFTTITGIIAALQTFTQAYIMTSGGPNHASLFYVYYIYSHAFRWYKMGTACALAWIFFVIVFVISMIALKVASKFVYYEAREGGEIL